MFCLVQFPPTGVTKTYECLWLNELFSDSKVLFGNSGRKTRPKCVIRIYGSWVYTCHHSRFINHAIWIYNRLDKVRLFFIYIYKLYLQIIFIRAAVFVREIDVLQIVTILKKFSPRRIMELKENGEWLYKNYFDSMEKITETTLEILVDRVFPHLARNHNYWNIPGKKVRYFSQYKLFLNTFVVNN